MTRSHTQFDLKAIASSNSAENLRGCNFFSQCSETHIINQYKDLLVNTGNELAKDKLLDRKKQNTLLKQLRFQTRQERKLFLDKSAILFKIKRQGTMSEKALIREIESTLDAFYEETDESYANTLMVEGVISPKELDDELKNTVEELYINYLLLIPYLKKSLEIEKRKGGIDDEDPDQLETAVVLSMDIPLYAREFLSESKKNHPALNEYLFVCSNYIFPFFEILSGIFAIHSIYNLLKRKEVSHLKTRIAYHAIVIGRITLSCMALGGLVGLNTLGWAGLFSSAYSLYKSSYILYHTHQAIIQTEEHITALAGQIAILREAISPNKETPIDPAYKENVEAQITLLEKQKEYHEICLQKLKVKEYYQKRAVYRSTLLLLAAGLSVGSLFIPALSFVAFGIAVLVTIQARKDLLAQRELRYLEKGEKTPSITQSLKDSIKESTSSAIKKAGKVRHFCAEAKTSVCAFFNAPTPKPVDFSFKPPSEKTLHHIL